MNPLNAVAEAFKEIGRVVRIFSVGGRRVQRFTEQQTWRWVEPAFGMNRHERRKYLVQLRRQHKPKPERFPIRDPDLVEE